MNFLRKNTLIVLVLCGTVGLLPYHDPHILGKLKWIAGGGAFSGEQPMQVMDWLDVLFHGFPWVLLLLTAAAHLAHVLRKTKQ